MRILPQLRGRRRADVEIFSGDAKLSLLQAREYRGRAARHICMRDVRLAGLLALRRRACRVADTERVAGAVDPTECERELIHVPGTIQPHGVLFNLRESDLAITQVSVNALDVLGVEAQNLLQQPLMQFVDDECTEHLRQALGLKNVAVVNPVRVELRNDQRSGFDGVVHRHGGALIFELEPRSTSEERYVQNAASNIGGALELLQSTPDIQTLCETTAEEVRRITGFDRVMVYKFDPEWNGEVIAEAKAEETGSYLHHRFPASDIPAQARKLYALNRIRFIPTVDYRPAGLIGTADLAGPLDMSFAVLRSVSPIHLEYLKNMGVAASMSISLLHDGRLWGLVACHHRSPRYLPYAIRQNCQLIGQAASSQIRVKEATSNYSYHTERTSIRAKFIEHVAGVQQFAEGLTGFRPNLLDFVEASGAAVFWEDQYTTVGEAPDEGTLGRLREWVRSRISESLYWTDSLPSVYELRNTLVTIAKAEIEREQAEEQQGAKGGAQAAVRGKSEFLASMSPEI